MTDTHLDHTTDIDQQHSADDSVAGALSASFLNRRSQTLRKPPAMLYGAIDIGTNSVHFVLVEISPEGDFRFLGSDKEMVKLGQGGFSQNVLTQEAMDAGVATLRRFKQMAQSKGVRKLKAVATSAVREAHNGGDFVKRVQDELDLDINVISMEEEGRLIYLGVQNAVDLRLQDNLIVDIGGGSVEIIVGDAREAKLIRSVKLGGSRLAELFLHSDPNDTQEIKALRQHISKKLDPVLAEISKFSITRCIGTSGTIRSLTSLCERRRGAPRDDPNAIQRLTYGELRDTSALLQNLPRAKRLQIAGMDTRRVDQCLPAALVLEQIMKAVNVDALEHCTHALREGVIVDYIGTHRRKLLARATWPDPRMRSVIQLAERCQYRPEHSEHVAAIAVQLFDGLRPLHGLGAPYRELLLYAGLLHDIGYLIDHQAHHKHAYYLISNGRLKGFDAQEIQIIANVARYHRKDRPRKSHYSFQQLQQAHREPVRLLAVIMRLSDALDRTHYQVVDGVTATIADEEVTLTVRANQDAELELWTARRAADIFKREFGRSLALRIADIPVKEEETDGLG